MHADAERWNARYGQPHKNYSFTPDPVLIAHESLLPDEGLALELACGTAGNALWLAEKGFRCVGLDVSVAGLRLAGEEARRRGLHLGWVVADGAALPLVPGCADLVVVTRFLDRALFVQIRNLLGPGGVVFYRTFNQRRRLTHPSFNPEFLLRDGELRQAFAGLQVLAGGEDVEGVGDSSYILARCPEQRTVPPQPRSHD